MNPARDEGFRFKELDRVRATGSPADPARSSFEPGAPNPDP